MMHKKIDDELYNGLQQEIENWKKDNSVWVSTLDFFLSQQYIKDGIKEYVDKHKKNWMKWFREEVG